jgi:hypothetical protein
MSGYYNNDDHVPGILLLPAFLIGALLSGLAVACVMSDCWQADAVKSGHGEYVMDPATGNSTWRWKANAEAKP